MGLKSRIVKFVWRPLKHIVIKSSASYDHNRKVSHFAQPPAAANTASPFLSSQSMHRAKDAPRLPKVEESSPLSCDVTGWAANEERLMGFGTLEGTAGANRQVVTKPTTAADMTIPELEPGCSLRPIPICDWKVSQQLLPNGFTSFRLPGHARSESRPAGAKAPFFPASSPRELKPAASRRAPVTPESSPISAQEAHDMFKTIGELFKDMPYAVTGSAALWYYTSLLTAPTSSSSASPSLTSSYPSSFMPFSVSPLSPHISLLAPSSSCRSLRAWAISHGMLPLTSRFCSFAIPLSSHSDSSSNNGHGSAVSLSRAVHIRLIQDSEWCHVQTTLASLTKTRVLTLPGIVDQIARAYTHDLQRGESDVTKQTSYAKTIDIALRCIVSLDDESQYLQPDLAHEISKPTFWIPFHLSFPELAELMEEAGLRIDSERQSLCNGDGGRTLSEKSASGKCLFT